MALVLSLREPFYVDGNENPFALSASCDLMDSLLPGDAESGPEGHTL